MKFKHFFAIIVCSFALFCFVGCNPKVETINMDRYFNSKVTSNISSEKLSLSSFTSYNVDTSTLKNRKKLEFTAETNWIYGMYIEYVYASFYCNKDIKINQLKLTVTDLDSGEYDETLPEGTYKFVEPSISFTASRNKGYNFMVKINKTALNSTLKVTFELNDEVDSTFEWTLYNFRVYGEHKA